MLLTAIDIADWGTAGKVVAGEMKFERK